MRIILLRHGRPEFQLEGQVRARDLARVAESYDLSGVVDTPPKETFETVRDSRQVVCSHLPRSVESARVLGFSEVHLTDSLFCETAIPHFNSGSVVLPVEVWVLVLRLLWLFGFARNGESLMNARRRAKRAAARLIELAEEHQHVLLVGHGFMNRFIAKELRRDGWCGPSKQGKGFWGYGVYEKAEVQ